MNKIQTRGVMVRKVSQRKRAAVALAGVFLGLFLSLLSPVSAFAHAELTLSVPGNGEVVKSSPESVTLRWSEVVTMSEEQIAILDAYGEKVKFTAEFTDTAVSSAVLKPLGELDDGLWTVTWKTVSQDGHLVSGSFSFTVGEKLGSGTTSLEKKSKVGEFKYDRVLEVASWVAFITALGGLWSRKRSILFAAASIAVTQTVIRVWSLGESFGGSPLSAVGIVGEANAALAVLLGSVLLLIALTPSIWSTRARLIFAWSSVAAFTSQGVFSGHHLDLIGWRGSLALIAHLTHLFAATIWVASLIALALNRSVEQLRATRVRSTVGVGLLFPASLLLVLMLGVPLDNSDGRAWLVNLGIKSGLVIMAFTLGAMHHRKSKRGEEVSHRSVLVEIGVMLAVLGATGSITQYTPPAVAVSRSANASEAPSESKILFKDGSAAVLKGFSTLAGVESSWMLDLTGANGETLEAVSVEVTASNESVGILELPVPLSGSGGHWMGPMTLPVIGSWTLTIAVYIDEFTVSTTTTEIEVTSP